MIDCTVQSDHHHHATGVFIKLFAKMWPDKTLSPGRAGNVAHSVQWGAWHGVGMVAGNSAVLSRMRRGGIGTVSPTMGLAAMQRVLTAQVASPQVLPPAGSVFNQGWVLLNRLTVRQQCGVVYQSVFRALCPGRGLQPPGWGLGSKPDG